MPRKTDMERKLEIYNFSARTRQLFIRLIALVKWANSVSKVDKSAVGFSFFSSFDRFAESFSFFAEHHEFFGQTKHAVCGDRRYVGSHVTRNFDKSAFTQFSHTRRCRSADHRLLQSLADMHTRAHCAARSHYTRGKATNAVALESGHTTSTGHWQALATNARIQGKTSKNKSSRREEIVAGL